ncbi:type I-E CRISPR-associated protein Cse1/CasA [Saccharothrix australiensis]|uniref:CRISPR-associated Cse1 family protein n=1 Tax=Saccharothrix australiensis TaxID=2072 RepID=A0A495W2S4_9PSEU|nr:type I-E CRISPR-associated protein Cse1/CasA [Saccharothrix australiensis]RKT54138.1 CRISPR-associated Cse1 family protein [Saccharothrix australiensis]
MNGDDTVSFNLVDRPWLTARTRHGHEVELSLLDVFRRSHEVTALLGDVPTQVFALTRLLLAVLHRALRGPQDFEEWAGYWQDGLPVDKIADYLAVHRHRFDLLDGELPFMQVPGLRTAKDEVSELDRLIADVPNGHPYFTTRLGGVKTLSFAEAARWLVHCHAFDPSGIKSGAADDPRTKQGKGYPIGTGWAGNLGGVVPVGKSLRDTLLLNLLPYHDDADLPAWERDRFDPVKDAVDGLTPTGRVDLYTWQSRRIRLTHDGQQVTGVLICNGKPLGPQNRSEVEPHTAWRRSQAQEKKLRKPLVYMPREHDPQKAVWRGLQPLLPGAVPPQGKDAAPFLTPGVVEWVAEVEDVIGEDYFVRLHTVGMTYGAQSATTTEIIDDVVALHAVLLRRADLAHTAVDCVRDAENAARALGKLARNLGEAAGYRPDPRAKPGTRDGVRDQALELAYASMDPLFRKWLREVTADTEPLQARADWHRAAWGVIHRLGKDMLDRAPVAAWTGRVANKRFITSSHAYRWFLNDLRTALPFANADFEVTS